MSGFEEEAEEEDGGGEGSPSLFDNDEAGAETGTETETEEGGTDIAAEEDAGRDIDGAAKIEVGTGGRVVVVVGLVVVVVLVEE